MSIRFVIGRAGSGKTHHCLRSIADQLRDAPLGPAVIWLLPRSATFQAERQLACDAGLKGFFRCRVLSIESFVQTVMDECGRADWTAITPLGRRMILGHLLRREAGNLTYFKSSVATEGLIQRLDATFGEIDRANAAQTIMQTAPDDKDPTLSSKLHDLRHLYEAYNDYVGLQRLDPHRRMTELLDRIGQCPLLTNTSVYVDAYTHFSRGEMQILASTAKAAARMELTLTLDPRDSVLENPHHRIDEFSLFHRTADAYQQLWFAFTDAGVEIESPLTLQTLHRFAASPDLAQVERVMAANAATTAPLATQTTPNASSCAIEFVEAPTRHAEVDAAARRIQDWLQQGLRLRQIAVLARDLSGYEEPVATSFQEHGIPFFLDRRRDARHHPLPQLLGEAIRCARDNWPQDSVISLLKSGLMPVSPSESDEIEDYVLKHRIRGAGWASQEPWTFISTSHADDDNAAPPTPLQQEQAQRIDALRHRAIDPLSPFVTAMRRTSLSVGAMVGELRGLLQRLEVAGRLARWIEQATERAELELAAEHQRVWDETHSLLEQMEQLLGDRIMPLDDFASLFQAALEEFDLALTPPTLDQVLVGQLDRTVAPPVRAVIVLGLNEGAFPAIPHENSILNDADRRSLGARKCHLEPDTRRQLLDERLLAYTAFTRAGEHLCLMRPRGQSDGKAAAPSVFWRELRSHFPSAPLHTIASDAQSSPDMIGTPRQLVDGLMHWVRDADHAEKSPPAITAPPFETLYQWFAAGKCDSGPIDRLRHQAWPALSYMNQASLAPHLASSLFAPDSGEAGTLNVTAANLESFAACPFQHFARHGLKLDERGGEQEVTLLDMNHLYHRILRRIVSHLLARKTDWPQANSQLIDKLTLEAGAAIKNEWMLSTGRNQYLLGRIARTIEQVVARQRAASTREHFKPAFAGARFTEALVLTTPQGNTLRLGGFIDRLDLTPDGAAVVTDYRLTGKKLVLGEVMHGLSLKLLISLLALRSGGEKLNRGRLTPAAAFYMQLFHSLESIAHPDDAGDPDDPAFDLKIKPRGLINEKFLPDLDHELQEGHSSVVSAYVKKDGSCGRLQHMDTTTEDQMNALLDHVQTLVCRMADDILKGDIDIHPYRLGNVTPCPRCAYKSLCRFDPATDKYHHLTPMKREDVLKQLEAPLPPVGDDKQAWSKT